MAISIFLNDTYLKQICRRIVESAVVTVEPKTALHSTKNKDLINLMYTQNVENTRALGLNPSAKIPRTVAYKLIQLRDPPLKAHRPVNKKKYPIISPHPAILGSFKQQRRRRLRKRQLKSEVALLHTLSRSFHLVQFVKYWPFFLGLNSNRLIEGQENKKEVVVLCSRPPQNVKIGIFTSQPCNDSKEMYKEA